MTSVTVKELVKAFTLLEGEQEVQNFLIDLCTPQELKAMAERWEIAKLLQAQELSYRDISEKTGASTATITRVARFLHHEPHHGYKSAIARL